MTIVYVCRQQGDCLSKSKKMQRRRKVSSVQGRDDDHRRRSEAKGRRGHDIKLNSFGSTRPFTLIGCFILVCGVALVATNLFLSMGITEQDGGRNLRKPGAIRAGKSGEIRAIDGDTGTTSPTTNAYSTFHILDGLLVVSTLAVLPFLPFCHYPSFSYINT